ncbi:MAG: hypothetical protein ACI4DY_06640 [Monoglobaceae bacterium]
MNRYLSVKFGPKYDGKEYAYLDDNTGAKVGDFIIVESSRGYAVAKVYAIHSALTANINPSEIKKAIQVFDPTQKSKPQKSNLEFPQRPHLSFLE